LWEAVTAVWADVAPIAWVEVVVLSASLWAAGEACQGVAVGAGASRCWSQVVGTAVVGTVVVAVLETVDEGSALAGVVVVVAV